MKKTIKNHRKTQKISMMECIQFSLLQKRKNYLLTVCLCSKYSYSVSGYGRLSSSSFLHFLPHKYPATKPTRRAASAPATTAITKVSTEYCEGSESAAATAGPDEIERMISLDDKIVLKTVNSHPNSSLARPPA